jgi:hypothetical protein
LPQAPRRGEEKTPFGSLAGAAPASAFHDSGRRSGASAAGERKGDKKIGKIRKVEGRQREAPKALAQRGHVEVHEQADADGQQLHVGKDLRRVQGKQPLDRLELHDDCR